MNTKRLKEAVKKSAESMGKINENVKEYAKSTAKSTFKSGNMNFKDHKHCKICGKTISPNRDDLLCNSQDCIDKVEKDLKVKKQLRLWMIILVIALLSPQLLTLSGIL